MEEFEKIESLLKTKSYDELTSSERSLVDEAMGEGNYDELRMGITQLQHEKMSVGSDVKRALINEMKANKSMGWVALFQKKIPAYTQLVSLLLIVAIYYLIPTNEKTVFKDRIVEIPVYDTVTITQTDTLWLERKVEVPRTIYVTQEIPKVDEKESKHSTNSRSLSEQKDVMDLVVRGLD